MLSKAMITEQRQIGAHEKNIKLPERIVDRPMENFPNI
jgi:hypothetical protein